MKSLNKRLEKIEAQEPVKKPCSMAFKQLDGSYRIGKKILSESEFQEYENDNRVILMTPFKN